MPTIAQIEPSVPRLIAASRNPLDATRPEELRIEQTARAALNVARRLPLDDIESAIRRGSAVPLFKSQTWRAFIGALNPLEGEIDLSAQKGARRVSGQISRPPDGSYLAAHKPIILDPEIAELGANWARLHAGQLIRGIDARTRANIRRLVRNAARRLARNPRGVVLAELAAAIRDQIGLTSKQGQALARALRKWIDQGKTAAQVATLKAERIRSMLDSRARLIAAREVAESFNEGAIRAAKLAQKKDRLPLNIMKVARTVGDNRVRERHTRQANLGPIPLDQDFALFSAPRPPWPGEPG